MKPEIYDHFHPDERPFIDQATDWLERTSERHQVKLTDFLDPRRCYILQTLAVSMDDVQTVVGGGYRQAERKRAWIAPDYLAFEEEDLNIAIVSIGSPDSRFASLDHGDFLGALTGLGIKREKIGDIHVHQEACHVLICREMAAYVTAQLNQVHKVSVYTEILPPEQLKVVDPRLEEQTITVASRRLDAVLSELIRVSRAKALTPIRSGMCRVNWKPEENPAHMLDEGDILSVRGHGRFKIVGVEGLTKKGNVRMRVGKFI